MILEVSFQIFIQFWSTQEKTCYYWQRTLVVEGLQYLVLVFSFVFFLRFKFLILQDLTRYCLIWTSISNWLFNFAEKKISSIFQVAPLSMCSQLDNIKKLTAEPQDVIKTLRLSQKLHT